MEAFGIIIGVLGLIIAYATYHRQFNQPPTVFPDPEPIAEKENLKIHFKAAQKLSLEVQELIQTHINNGNGDRAMYWGVTFQQYLDLQKSEFQRCLSDDLYKQIDELPANKFTIDSMTRSISAQSDALQQIKNQMALLLAQEVQSNNNIQLNTMSFSLLNEQRTLKPAVKGLIEKHNGDTDIFEMVNEDIYITFFQDNTSLENFKVELNSLIPHIIK